MEIAIVVLIYLAIGVVIGALVTSSYIFDRDEAFFGFIMVAWPLFIPLLIIQGLGLIIQGLGKLGIFLTEFLTSLFE